NLYHLIRESKKLISENKFRQDLLYRLNTVEIRIPPLRERIEDILPLAMSFLAQHNQKYQLNVAGFDETAIDAMQQYDWPGNVRELNHMVERALFLCAGDKISDQDLGFTKVDSHDEDISQLFSGGTLDDIECTLIKQRMAKFDNKALETSQSLGLSRSAYYRRLEKYNL
ncbi:MAG: sigma-54-dependent Fis family transcriptional regulator, partial [Psychrobium sp.]